MVLELSSIFMMFFRQPGKEIIVDGKKCKNFATLNFLGLLGNKRIEGETEKCIRKYGVGSCGPRGFYGTFGM